MTLGIMLEGVTLAIRAIEIKIPAFAGMTGGGGGMTWGRWGLGGGRGVGARLRGGFGGARGIRRGAGDSGGRGGFRLSPEWGLRRLVAQGAALGSSLRSE